MSFFDTFSSDTADEVTIDKSQFKTELLTRLKEGGFDFEDIDEDERLPKSLIPVLANEPEAFYKFNALLSTLHKEREINIVDAVCVLEHDLLKAEDVLKCLDELNYYIVTQELLKRHKIRQEEEASSILDFLD